MRVRRLEVRGTVSSGGEWRSSAAVALGLVALAMVGVGLWGVYAIAS